MNRRSVSERAPAPLGLRPRVLGAYRTARRVGRRTGRWFLRTGRGAIRVGRNTLMCGLGRADVDRWASPLGLEEWWVGRTEQMARLVPPGSKVIEFGAGRRALEKVLPAGCTYVPSDLVDRGPGTIVCDLNDRPLPDLRRLACDVAVFAGVLEYVKDVGEVMRWLAGLGVRTCIASFDPAPERAGLTGRWREWARRSYFGYMNRLSEAGLVRCAAEAGFTCMERQTWTNQIILRFERKA